MPKPSKSPAVKAPRPTGTGEFVVVKPAVSSDLTVSRIREAVRKVNEAQAGKK